jgi:hypothetical protein
MWIESRAEGHAISHEDWDYVSRGSSKYFMTISCIHSTSTCGVHVCFQTIALYAYDFANDYDVNTLRMRYFCIRFCGQAKRVLRVRMCSPSAAVTSRHGIIILLSEILGIGSSSTSSSGTFSWTLSATGQADCSTISRFS